MPFTEVIKFSMVIKPLLMSALETALNQFLEMDQNRAVFLTPLSGKIIAMTLLPFNETIYLCPTSDAIQLLDYSPDQPDTQLTGSFFCLWLNGAKLKTHAFNFLR